MIVAFSGGIDSTALALAMPDATLVFADTGWEFPHVYEHLARFSKVTSRPVVRVKSHLGTLPDYIRDSMFMPSHGARYCTYKFKIAPMNKWLKKRLPRTLNIALRADEHLRVGNQTNIKGLTIGYPLRENGMTRIDCVRICADNDLLPRYPPYAARGGCIGCFYKRKSEVIAMKMLVPAALNKLRLLEESVQDEQKRFFHMFPNTGVSIKEIQAQEPLFDFRESYAEASDTSDYGTACGLYCNR